MCDVNSVHQQSFLAVFACSAVAFDCNKEDVIPEMCLISCCNYTRNVRIGIGNHEPVSLTVLLTKLDRQMDFSHFYANLKEGKLQDWWLKCLKRNQIEKERQRKAVTKIQQCVQKLYESTQKLQPGEGQRPDLQQFLFMRTHGIWFLL